jgi:hypothetical protein
MRPATASGAGLSNYERELHSERFLRKHNYPRPGAQVKRNIRDMCVGDSTKRHFSRSLFTSEDLEPKPRNKPNYYTKILASDGVGQIMRWVE